MKVLGFPLGVMTLRAGQIPMHHFLTPPSWSVRVCSALNDVVRVKGQPYPLANSSGEARLNPSGPFRVIHLFLLQTYAPRSCSCMGRAVQASVSYLPLPALQPDPRPAQARGWSPVDARSFWIRPLSRHRVLVPGMAVETAKKGLSPSSLRQSRMASGGQDLGVRHPPCLLPASQHPLGQWPKLAGETYFLRGKKKKKKKRKEKRGSTKKTPNPKDHLCNG